MSDPEAIVYLIEATCTECDFYIAAGALVYDKLDEEAELEKMNTFHDPKCSGFLILSAKIDDDVAERTIESFNEIFILEDMKGIELYKFDLNHRDEALVVINVEVLLSLTELRARHYEEYESILTARRIAAALKDTFGGYV